MADEIDAETFGGVGAADPAAEDSVGAALEAALESEEERQERVRQARILEFKIKWMKLLVQQAEGELEDLTGSAPGEVPEHVPGVAEVAKGLGEPPFED